MRRKNIFAALLCSVCLAVSAVAAAATAEENGTEAVSEAPQTEDGAQESADADEADTEQESVADAINGAEESTEAETEMVVPEKPEYMASDYVTLGEYKGLTVVRETPEVTEEEIEQEILFDLQNSDQLETVTEGAVQDGDTVNIDYEGKKDGVAFDGGTAKGYDLTIGSDTFIDGFEDGLIGVAVGTTVDLPLTFPENYGSEDLAGADVVFTVTVNEIKRVPELTDEVASAITDGAYPDVASYRESIRAMLMDGKEEQIEDNLMGDLLTQIANESEIHGYPQDVVDYYVTLLEQNYRSAAEMYSMEFEDFLSAYLEMTPEQFQEEAVMTSQEMLQQEMYLKAIAEAEGMELSDEEYEAGTQRYAEQYGYETAEELIAANDEEEIRISLLQEKVLDFLMENANIVDAEVETETETEFTSAELATEAAEAETVSGETEAESTESGTAEAETEPESETEA